MQLSQNQKFFYHFPATVLKSKLSFENFEKEMTLTAFVFPKLRTLKTWLDKSLKSPVSEDCSKSNVVNLPKHCLNQHHSTLIIFIDQCQGS